jgi:hypothetical protein
VFAEIESANLGVLFEVTPDAQKEKTVPRLAVPLEDTVEAEVAKERKGAKRKAKR